MSMVTAYAGSAGSNFDGAGTKVITNPAHMTGAPDGSNASSTNSTANSTVTTQSFDIYNFFPAQFTAGTSLQGVLFTMTAVCSLGAGATVTIVSGDTQLDIGSAIGSPTVGWSSTTLTTSSATYTVGGSTDLWGINPTLLTVSNLNSSVEGTGPTLSVNFSLHAGACGSAIVQVDAVQMTAYYTVPSNGIYEPSGVASGSAQASGMIGLPLPFIVGNAVMRGSTW
jgi:hypothetical protein